MADIPVTAIKTDSAVQIQLYILQPWHWIEVRGQCHTLAPLILGKEHPVATDFSNLLDTEIQQLL